MARLDRSFVVVVAAVLAATPLAALAQDATPVDCAALLGRMPGAGGDYAVSDARPVLTDGWCQIDGPMLRGRADDVPNISATSVRLRGTEVAGALMTLEVQIGGLKVVPKIGDRAMDDRLRSFLRLQTADLAFMASVNPEADVLEIRGFELTLPGRNRLMLSADIRGADLSAVTQLLGGSVTALDMELVTDGRIARPLMQMAGDRMLPEGAAESDAVAAVREVLAAVIEAVPVAALDDAGKSELTAMLRGLPQTTGTLILGVRSEAGISPARLAVNGLRKDPLSPVALANLLGDVALTVDWKAGVTP
jgi:hypothetical protein